MADNGRGGDKCPLLLRTATTALGGPFGDWAMFSVGGMASVTACDAGLEHTQFRV